MSENQVKPLNWKPDPNIGYTVERRPDGGMNIRFSDVSEATLKHWRDFSMDHLLDSDRLTRNLYDLRAIKDIPQAAIDYAVEVNTDPSVRNIRLAVLVTSEQVSHEVSQIAALTTPGGVEMAIFHDLEAAEAWLARPLTLVI